jgi:DNA-binding transcriptional regulator YhcF (GntR family)
MELIKGKQADIVQHCIYEIATGKWAPGLKLPSVRSAEQLWGVNRLTVLNAYRELERIGLVTVKDRSGYYVSEGEVGKTVDTGLNQLYTKVKALIERNTDFDLSYIFKYFGGMAISESRSNPNYAFLECTQQQADDHASEIYHKLNVFVKPVCLDSDDELSSQIPDSIQTLLTTGFHIKDVKRIGKKLKKEVVNIPIEVDTDLLAAEQNKTKKAFLVELESNMSSNISRDLQNLAGKMEIVQRLITDVDKDMPEIMENPANELILLSPRVWGRCAQTIKKDERVKLIRFKISSNSWKIVSSTLKIPLRLGKTEPVS